MFNRLALIMVNILPAVLVSYVSVVGMNCWWITYEPDFPESLKHGI